MQERFSDRMLSAMKMANREAKSLDEGEIETEHLLIGLLLTSPGVAMAVLRNLKVNVPLLKHELEKLLPKVPSLPRSLGTQQVIERATEESRNLGHNYIGTEHALLGLLGAQGSRAAQVLANAGVGVEAVRAEVLMVLGKS